MRICDIEFIKDGEWILGKLGFVLVDSSEKWGFVFVIWEGLRENDGDECVSLGLISSFKWVLEGIMVLTN